MNAETIKHYAAAWAFLDKIKGADAERLSQRLATLVEKLITEDENPIVISEP